jgi:virginiamycin B lyase
MRPCRRCRAEPPKFVRLRQVIGHGWRLWLGVAFLAVALGGAVAWLTNPNGPGGRFVEYRMQQPLDTPTAIATAADGTIWFTIDLASAIGRISNGQLERLPLPSSNVEPIGLGAGPDGSAWYTDNSVRGISRITPAGQVSSFPLGTPLVRLGRLAVSPHGEVWFAEATGYSITRLKDGEITRHVFESPRGDPYGVAVAADGTVWATLRLGNQLVHITADGEITTLDLPKPAAAPSDIATGPDGSVWFIELRENRIGRLVGDVFEDYEVPGDRPTLTGLAVAGDGAVWFGMLRSGALGRLQDGRVEIFPLPRDTARPCGVAVDPDGNVWYADISGYVGMLPMRYARR